MEVLSLISDGAVVVFILLLLLWLVSLFTQDASIIDRTWGLGFVLLCWTYAWSGRGMEPPQILLNLLVTIWGVRLSWHIHVRNRQHGEDYRYQQMRRVWGARFWWVSFFTVFMLQGVLMLVISMPLAFAHAYPASLIGVWALLGTLLWGIGFYFEAMGDLQLKRFKADKKNQGKVMNQGLWALTRHPNYFGDALLWFGFFCFALNCGAWGVTTLFSPLLMTYLLMKVSGVSLLEKNLQHSKPGYAEYVARTPAFFPKIWRSR